MVRSLVPLFILLLASLLRFYNLSGQSLWADEGNSVALARRSFVEIAQRTAFDIHPPFYYWLLKSWIFIFGDSEIGLRSLSAVLGVGLVYVIGVLGTRLFNARVGLLAAFIAALSPFQVYYAQEARMYILLALLSSLTVLAALLILKKYLTEAAGKNPARLIYLLVVTAGLYTHYAYPLILLAVNLVALLWFWQATTQIPPETGRQNQKSEILTWLACQLIPLLLYFPWLPTAWRQLTTWPADKQSISFIPMVETISTTLLFGLSWPFDLSLIPAIGLGLALLLTLWFSLLHGYPLPTHRAPRFTFHPALPLLWLWLLLPLGLTALVFSPAFLKFLLVAAPALALLLALTLERLVGRAQPPAWLGYLVGGALLASLTGASLVSLYAYYTDKAYARDNYRGIVNFIQAVGGPADAVILNAEGQQDVFAYYYGRSATPEAPVYPLPRHRPLDQAATRQELQHITGQADKIYAVYWATQQADPAGLIEGWLNNHLVKATDQWYGNVRLVSYANPRTGAQLTPTPVDYQLGQHIRLTGYALSATQLRPGEILQVVLTWESTIRLSPSENYTVFLQILDPANHLVGQRDAPPLIPTTDWPARERMGDAHGIFIEPGTPPGPHRLIAGLYDSQTGQRLPVFSSAEAGSRDFIELGQVEIIRPAPPLPAGAFNIQVPLNVPMLEVTLLGYDLYKLGHRSTPDTPLHPGDPVHLVAYWLARQPVRWLQDQLFIQVITPGGQATPIFLTRPPAGTDYSIKEWQAGEIIRAQYDFFLSNVEPGTYHLALTLNVSETSTQRVVALTKPFRVEALPVLAPVSRHN